MTKNSSPLSCVDEDCIHTVLMKDIDEGYR